MTRPADIDQALREHDVEYALGVLRAHGCTVGRHVDDHGGAPSWWVVTRSGRKVYGISEAALCELADGAARRGDAAQPSLLGGGS